MSNVIVDEKFICFIMGSSVTLCAMSAFVWFIIMLIKASSDDMDELDAWKESEYTKMDDESTVASSESYESDDDVMDDDGTTPISSNKSVRSKALLCGIV